MTDDRDSLYKSLGDILTECSAVFQPPERLTVSEAAKKYVYLHNPPAYIGPWKSDTVPYMDGPMDTFSSRDHTGLIFVSSAQSAKALPLTTPIPVPGGWSTMGELEPGDKLFDETGRVCKVISMTGTMRNHDCYTVQFDDGTQIVADGGHLWAVDDMSGQRNVRRVLTTEEMIPNIKMGKAKPRNRYAIPVAGALHLPKARLPIKPYTLGVWLGDGLGNCARVCGSPQDLTEVGEYINEDGYETRAWTNAKGLRMMDYGAERTGAKGRVRYTKGCTGANKPLQDLGLLKDYGGRGKHIPAIYLRASYDQRLALLQGLMDTDGTCSKSTGTCSFTNTNRAVVDGVSELIASLGFKYHIRETQPTCRYLGEITQGATAWKITFSAYADTPVFRLKRKVEIQRPRGEGRPGYTERRQIVSITPAKSVPVKCITVDSKNHLYLAGREMVPTHNTQGLILNTLAYTIRCNAVDVILFNPSQSSARDFSKRRVDRLHRYSKDIGSELLPGQHSDNTFDKFYKSGMMFTMSWPSINEMSGKPVPIVMMTDYDRMPMDVDGEGAPFDLGQKRTTTFKSFGMTVAESSPSKEVLDGRWKATTPHEAPPCEGILSLYNRGDRRRWYWPCPHCNHYFEGSFSDLKWDNAGDAAACAKTVYMMCPGNACVIKPESRYDMNLRGVWAREDQTVNEDGSTQNDGVRSEMASFWLKGVAAAFTTWPNLVLKYLNAELDYARTGAQDALKTTVNTDQGEPYLPRGMQNARLAEDLQSLAVSLPEKMVPEDVRCLFATCDVQKNRWEVQIHGVRPGAPYELVVIDRFAIVKSNRMDEDGERLWVKPAEEPEDWDLLITEVMDRRYPLADKSGTMGVAMTVCDSGGREGVTGNAYLFYSRLKRKGLAERFLLLKGDSSPNAPRVAISFPDSRRKDRMAKARGEVPVLMINANMLKDTLDGMLPREEESTPEGVDAGGELSSAGRIQFPDWLNHQFFEELTVEVRTVRGWENKHGRRNETFDLLVYCLACCVHRKIEHVSWDAPPVWLLPWGENPFVTLADKKAGVATKSATSYGRAQLGEALG